MWLFMSPCSHKCGLQENPIGHRCTKTKDHQNNNGKKLQTFLFNFLFKVLNSLKIWKSLSEQGKLLALHQSCLFTIFPSVNFTNILRLGPNQTILCARFLYESLLSSFSLLRVWFWANFRMKNARVKCWWNWHLD